MLIWYFDWAGFFKFLPLTTHQNRCYLYLAKRFTAFNKRMVRQLSCFDTLTRRLATAMRHAKPQYNNASLSGSGIGEIRPGVIAHA